MRKRSLLCVAILAAIVIFTGCVSQKDYDRLAAAQKSVGDWQSGRIVVTSSVQSTPKNTPTTTDFVFRRLESGAFAYCQTQYDAAKRAVYCEYCDGEKTEQWLIGRGWSVLDPAEGTHRYLALLSTPFEKSVIDDLLVTEEDGNRRYYLTLDAAALNRTRSSDGATAVVEESLEILTSAEDELLSYADACTWKDCATGEEHNYRLELQLCDQNAISSVERPEL